MVVFAAHPCHNCHELRDYLIIDWSFKYNIGFSKIVSLGNMAGVDELEILEYN